METIHVRALYYTRLGDDCNISDCSIGRYCVINEFVFVRLMADSMQLEVMEAFSSLVRSLDVANVGLERNDPVLGGVRRNFWDNRSFERISLALEAPSKEFLGSIYGNAMLLRAAKLLEMKRQFAILHTWMLESVVPLQVAGRVHPSHVVGR